jgi:integrase
VASKRRSPGEGSIHRRKDGRWTAVLSEGGREDRRRRYVYGATKREVVDKLRELPSEAETYPKMSPLVGEFFEHWLTTTLPLQVRQSTVLNYGAMVRKHFLPTFKYERLSDVTSAKLESLYVDKVASGLSRRSVALLHAVVRRGLGDAVRLRHVSVNVAREARPPRVPRRHGRSLTPDETKVLLSTVQGHPLEPFVVLGLFAGLRPGESLALRWEDVDLDRGFLIVRTSLTRAHGGTFVVGEVKTSTSLRSVHLADIARDILRRHEATGFVIQSPAGQPLDPANVRRGFKALTKAAGLGEWRPHELRHTCASLLLNAGVPLKVVADVLGHSSVAVTGDVYGHVLDPSRDAAAHVLGHLLG